MAVKKFYAVKNGRKIGIFTKWNDLQKQIFNYKNAEYKIFSSKEDAQRYLFLKNINNIGSEENIDAKYDAVSYTDGSFSKNKNNFSYGIIIFFKNQKFEFCERFNDKKWIKMKNVAGEIMGVVKAAQFCYENKIKSLLIYHDYNGLSKWISGEWKTANKEIWNYKKFIYNLKKYMIIDFKWIKSHSDNKYNDIADYLSNCAYNLNCISPVLLK